MTPLASLHHIKKNYQKPLLAIDEFTIHQGQCALITGDNGSGKTTLLKIINGLINADEGVIGYQGAHFAAHRRHPLSAQSIYLSSEPYLFDCCVEHNIAYPLWLKRPFSSCSSTTRNTINEMLKWADLEPLRKRHPSTLSSGERQKVALARARVLNPPLWLLDEPTDNLDELARQQVCELITNLLAEGHSIIIVTHHKDYFHSIPHSSWQLSGQTLINRQTLSNG